MSPHVTDLKIKRLTAALKLIASPAGRFRCTSFTTGPGECFRSGRRPYAKYDANKCCNACIAWAALHPDKVAKKGRA